MGIFQEAAVIAGDLITQPIRKAVVESLSGYNFKIKRKTINNETLDNFVKGKKEYKVVWDLELVGKKKQTKPEYTFK